MGVIGVKQIPTLLVFWDDPGDRALLSRNDRNQQQIDMQCAPIRGMLAGSMLPHRAVGARSRAYFRWHLKRAGTRRNAARLSGEYTGCRQRCEWGRAGLVELGHRTIGRQRR